MEAELKPCPFCGNKAVTFAPNEDRNIISCALGHAPMRSVEAWNTRARSSEAAPADLLLRNQAENIIDSVLRFVRAGHGRIEGSHL